MAPRLLRRSSLSLAIVAGLVAPAALAQQAEPPVEEPSTLATLTVTAQKREEALQDVPIMLTVLPEQLMRDAGITDIKDV